MISTIVFIAFIAFLMYLGFYRNTKVYHFRQELIDAIYNANVNALNEAGNAPGATLDGLNALGDQLTTKWRIYEDVSYNEMVLKFWKPLTVEAWYGDTLPVN